MVEELGERNDKADSQDDLHDILNAVVDGSDDESDQQGSEKKQASEQASKELSKQGILPDVKIESSIAAGDVVSHSGARWNVKGEHNGKLVIQSPDQQSNEALKPVDRMLADGRPISYLPQAPDAANYKALDVPGNGFKYYVDKNNKVHRVLTVANGYLMSEAPDMKIVDKNDATRVSKAVTDLASTGPEKEKTPKTPGERNERSNIAERAGLRVEDVPKVGDKVNYKNEELKIGGYRDGHALLYQTGRNKNFELVGPVVTPTELESKYDKVSVNIDGKNVDRYVPKGQPKPVYELIKPGSALQLSVDHQFEVASVKSSNGKVRFDEPAKVEQKVTSTGAPKHQPGDTVNYKGEQLKIAGTSGEHTLLYQKDRNKNNATAFKPVTGRELMADYHQVKVSVDGKEDIRFVDKKNPEHVYKAGVDGNKILLHRDFQFEVTKTANLAKASSTDRTSVEKTPAPAPASKPERETIKGEPKPGETVKYQGESLKVGGIKDGHALLYQTGRNANYALVTHGVTDRDLETKYEKIKVNIDGKETEKYIEKNNPRVVYDLMKSGDNKFLSVDHSFQVAPLENSSKADAAADRNGKKPAARELAVPKPGAEVKFKNEELTVGGYAGDHALLYRTGRNNDHTQVGAPVTAEQLKENYERVVVKVDGQLVDRYMQKDKQTGKIDPSAGVYTLFELGETKTMLQDHEFVVASKNELVGPKKTGNSLVDRAVERLQQKRDIEKVEKEQPRQPREQQQESATPRERVREVPSAERLGRVETQVRPDSTLVQQETRTGEARVEKRQSVGEKELETLKQRCAELEKSTKETDRHQARELRHTLDALDGRLGAEKQREAREFVSEHIQKEKGRETARGRAIAGGVISAGILVSAALAWYNARNKATGDQQEAPKKRASVGK